MANTTIALSQVEVILLTNSLDKAKDELLCFALPDYDAVGRLEAIKHKILRSDPSTEKA